MSLIKKENLVISIGEYEKDGQTKQQWRTIGEIITMQGDNGPYQFFKIWGAGGVTEGKVFSQEQNQAQPAHQQGYAQSPQQGHPYPPQQGYSEMQGNQYYQGKNNPYG